MGVSNVNNRNPVELVKLAMQKQAASAAAARKPDYMTMTGSIFNAPNARTTTNPTTLSDLNTAKTLTELHTRATTNPNPDNSTDGGDGTSSIDNITSIDNAADGRAAAAAAEQSSDEVSSLTAETENNTLTVNSFSTNAQKLDKQIAKDEKTFTTRLKKEEKALEKDNKTLEKLVRESEETQTEVENAQNELDSLMSTNAFTINDDGTQTNPNQDRINELSSFLNTKINLLQSNGQQIYSLQRSSSRTITKMQKTNNQFIKVQQTNTKQIEANQSTTSKVIEVADKVDQISALVAMTGQAVNYAGVGLVALGSSMTWAAGAGAALIAAGNVMQKVGKVTEMVGNYGQAAANVTKTAAYAADGNLAGALQSAAAAIQTGVAAGKSTKNLGKTFDQINEQANQATQKLASNTAAKDAVSEMTTEQLGGLNEKEMKKSISSQLQEKMAKGELDAKDMLSDIKNGQLSETNFTAVNNAADQTRTTFSSAVTNAHGKIENGVVSGLDDKARKEIGNKTVSKFSNTATNTIKSSQKFDWEKLGNGLTSVAARFNSQNTQTNYTANNNRTYAPQWDLSQDSRFQRIRNYRLSTGAMV